MARGEATRYDAPVAESKQLTTKQRQHLRALAHPLDPVVQIGRQGLTDGVVTELGHALRAHELVKVKVGSECPTPAAELGVQLGEAARAQLVQVIGRVVVVYRRREKNPKIELPQPTRRRRVKAAS